MQQNITLQKGKMILPSGIEVHFETAEFNVSGTAQVVAPSKEKKRKLKDSPAKQEKTKVSKGGRITKGGDFERVLVEILKSDTDGLSKSEIMEKLKEKEIKFNDKKLTNKLFNMKKSGDAGLQDGKYFLDEEYFNETKGKFVVNG